MSDKNIVSLFYKKIQSLAILMDEIDGMNNGDKGGINSLIKLIRPKKTKKQKNDDTTLNPIICIGNNYVDKKIKELIKVCHVIELDMPTREQIENIISCIIPTMAPHLKQAISKFVNGDLRKLKNIISLYQKNNSFLSNNVLNNIFLKNSHNDNTRDITTKLMSRYYKIEEHSRIMTETDRTIVGLLWHENIIDYLNDDDKINSVKFYRKALRNICFADYVDRITFQKQIWQFNEMSSLIKTFKNNKLYHDEFANNSKTTLSSDIRFTKVLTKYSTEYNNTIFIQNLCQELGMDRKDLFALFVHLRQTHSEDGLPRLFEGYNISKLDINRIYRYIDKYIHEDMGKIQNDNDCDNLSVFETVNYESV
jgi:hypothetical protein